MTVRYFLENYEWQAIVSLACIGVTVAVTSYQIHLHRTKMEIPFIQKRLILILASFPLLQIFVACSTAFYQVSLIFLLLSILVETLSVYLFLDLFIAYITYDPREGGKNMEAFYDYLLTKKKRVRHGGKCCTCKCAITNFHSKEGIDRWFRKVKFYVLQTVVVKPIVETALYIASAKGYDHKGILFLIRLPMVISVIISVYQLAYIYRNFFKELSYSRPTLKFICIKISVFIENIQAYVILQITGTRYAIGNENALA
eukprot:CAMPEP_0115016906 /NCGR_PEP_ID=MMETSP0216-20121206/27759_1 /TAXON_ID=223996 /ORGANISM="Protocruzia adherens, Strain Boccale" /LENGTH=256 /DNA_ID=CAMNT_0002387539 /DNA_START=353 /DNA_END=1119 /DNA_ORIENTATION=-